MIKAMQEPSLLRLAHALKSSGYRFITVTPATHARVNARQENGWARSVEDVFGWSRPFRDGLLDAELFGLAHEAGVLARHGDGWISTIRASTLHDQLFLHSSYPTTSGDAVFFGPDTYRFADAIERHLASGFNVRRAVDIGCGAGPGAITIALHRPDADVFASDINGLALSLTTINADVAGTKRVRARHSDLLNDVDGQFDLIVANPPYLLDAEERAYRHGGGSFGEGLSVAIAKLARTRLAPGGSLLLYTGAAVVKGVDRFRTAVAPHLDASRLLWEYRELDPDVFGEELLEPAYAEVDRIAAVVVIAHQGRG